MAVKGWRKEQPTEKACKVCNIVKPVADFITGKHARADGSVGIYYQAICKECDKARVREWHHTHPELSKQQHVRAQNKLRADVIAAYGGKCACCGEAGIEFLSIDHIHNDGAEHRRAMGRSSGTALYAYLRKRGYPKEDFQVLCYNCNCAKAHCGGVCPHQKEKTNAGDI